MDNELPKKRGRKPVHVTDEQRAAYKRKRLDEANRRQKIRYRDLIAELERLRGVVASMQAIISANKIGPE